MKLRSNEMSPEEYFTLLFLKGKANVQQKNEENSEFVAISVFLGSRIKIHSGGLGFGRGRVVQVGGKVFLFPAALVGRQEAMCCSSCNTTKFVVRVDRLKSVGS